MQYKMADALHTGKRNYKSVDSHVWIGFEGFQGNPPIPPNRQKIIVPFKSTLNTQRVYFLAKINSPPPANMRKFILRLIVTCKKQ